jgi:hypothetical protein
MKRLFTINNFTIILAFLFSLGFAILRVFGIGPNFVDTVVLFTLSALILWLLSEKLGYFDRVEKEIVGIHKEISDITSGVADVRSNLNRPSGVHAIYLSRDFLPPYEGFVETAHEQIIVISIDLEDTSSRYIDYLIELAKRNCHICLLAFNPESPARYGVAKLLGQREEGVKSRIRNNLERIMDHRSKGLPKEQSDKVQIRVYDWAPTWVGLAADPGSPKGKMLVGVCQHGPAKGTWPEFELRPGFDSALYDFYSKRFLQAWEDAIPWNGNTSYTTNK